MTVIGVFCARVRVEEKQLIGAFGEAGTVAMPVLPASSPMPPGPAVRHAPPPAADGTLDINDPAVTILIDRCANRYVAEASLPLLAARGVRVIGAGLAATGSRLDVASALTTAGVARPSTLLAFDEASANLAVCQIGVPAALFSLNAGKGWTHMQDLDTADAVVEHRMVLGRDAHSVVLVQAGAPAHDELTTLHVVGTQVRAFAGPAPDEQAIELAIAAASALNADVVSIQIALVSGQQVVWDVLPVADFRGSTLIGTETVASAIASHVLGSSAGSEVRHGLSINA